MPKGGRKGGRQFPQISLKDAAKYATRLVSKTHNGPQPEAIILKGVFDASGPAGGVRASAMKQYGMMDGNADGYKASELAKKIVNAPSEEQSPLLQQALLKPAVFNTLYETFKGDRVSLAKIRQQASSHDVHPDNLTKCVNLFVESAEFAGVAQKEGEDFVFSLTPGVQAMNPVVDEAEEQIATGDTPLEKTESKQENSRQSASNKPLTTAIPSEHAPSGRSVIHVNIALDSSLDTEKLEKQLDLLRRFGAI